MWARCLLLALLLAIGSGMVVSQETGTLPVSTSAPKTDKTLKPERDKTEKPAAERPRNGAKENLPAFTPEREAAALSFVRQHHPELVELLGQLKSANAKGYQNAVQELFRVSEKLANSKEFDPARYELDLQAWRLESRIRLLAARLMMTDSQTMKDELRGLIEEREAVRLQALELERNRLAARLEKLDASIAQAQQNHDAQVQQAFDALLRDISSRPKVKEMRAKNASGAAGNKNGTEADTRQNSGR